jgi:hypothetical protein
MSTWIFYVDESYDRNVFCLSALAVRDRDWQQSFDDIREFRRQLKSDYGIRLSKEIHATDFVSGRGKLGPKIVPKRDRAIIFSNLLQVTAKLPSAFLINICLEAKGLADAQMRAWERLINRIERTMRHFEESELKERANLVVTASRTGLDGDVLRAIEVRLNAYKPRAVIVADEGREAEITSALRRMHVHNPVPSKYGQWETGGPTKNIIAERIIEDPVFKKSERSYFLQLIDCVAYALLKRESPDKTPTVINGKIDQAFDQTLSGICYRKASSDDPLGIVR